MTDYTEAPLPSRRTIRLGPTRGRARVYDEARRHSLAVRWLKIGLPVLAALGVIGFIVATQLKGADGGDTVVSFAGINVDEKSLVMKAPHISGFEVTHKSYEVTAARAVQELDNPKVVTLESINAQFGMAAGGTATVNAQTGVFDGNKNTLHLSNGIVLDTTNGYHATLQDAQIDVTLGNLYSKSPVEVHAAKGIVKSRAIEIQNHGARVIFFDGVSVTYFAPKKGATEPAGTTPATAKPGAAAVATPTEKQAQASAASVQ